MATDYSKAEDSDKESNTEEAELTNPSSLDDKPTEPHQALAAFDYESDVRVFTAGVKSQLLVRRCILNMCYLE